MTSMFPRSSASAAKSINVNPAASIWYPDWRRFPFGIMERKVFWLLFIVLGLIMDVALPIWWSLALTIPLAIVCWWVAYKSGWFG
jgi:hypothetical protein